MFRMPSRISHLIKSDFQFLSRLLFKNSIGLRRNIKRLRKSRFANKDMQTQGFFRIEKLNECISNDLKINVKSAFNNPEYVKAIKYHDKIVQYRIKDPLQNIENLNTLMQPLYFVIKNKLGKNIKVNFISIMNFLPFPEDYTSKNDIYANKYHVDWTDPGKMRVFIPILKPEKKIDLPYFEFFSFENWHTLIKSGYRSRKKEGNIRELSNELSACYWGEDHNYIFDAGMVLHRQVPNSQSDYCIMLLIFECTTSNSINENNWLNNVGTLSREK